MTTISPDMPLGRLVVEHPEAASTLERLGLDYCCGGGRTITEAAVAAGLEPDTVLSTVGAACGAPQREAWADLGLSALTDHVESTHHTYLHAELPRLGALASKVASVHGAAHPELAEVERLVGELAADLTPHLRKEEVVLFPMIRHLGDAPTAAEVVPTIPGGSLSSPIAVMLGEHERTGEILAELRAASGDYVVPADGCASYQALYRGLAALEADTVLHVHKENNVLFPAAIAAEAAAQPA